MAKHIVTFAPPTPNGGLHIGHLSGSFLAADVYTRVFKLLGDDVVFVSYSDDYQSYLARKAKELDVNPVELAKGNHAKILSTLKDYHIDTDLFFSSSENEEFLKSATMFRQAVSEFISIKKDLVPYCESCSTWGFEAFARGTCVECGSDSDRSQCENCATAPEITGLTDIKCTSCGENAVLREVEREYLDLGQFRSVYKALSERSGVRKPLKDLLSYHMEKANLEWPIDRPDEYGVPCSEALNKKVSTWFSGLVGYYAATSILGKTDYWNDAEHCALFVGFDCSYSHAMVYPALMKSANLSVLDELRVYTNAFLKLDNKDFSTSRGVAVWADDLSQLIDVDYIRFYLGYRSPENEVSNFSIPDFFKTVNESIFLPLSKLSDRAIETQLSDLDVNNTIQSWLDQWHGAVSVEHHSMRNLANKLMDWLHTATNDRQSDEAPMLLAAWAILASPLMPKISREILSLTGIDLVDCENWLTGRSEFLPIKPEFHEKADSLKNFSLDLSDLEQLMS